VLAVRAAFNCLPYGARKSTGRDSSTRLAMSNERDEQCSSSLATVLERLDRVESAVRDEGNTTKLKIEELAKSIAYVRTSVGELKRACGPASSSGSCRGSVSKVDEYFPLLAQTVESTFSGELLTASCCSGLQSLSKKLCFPGDLTTVDPCVRKHDAKRFLQALCFGYRPKDTRHVYGSEAAQDHAGYRTWVVKNLFSNVTERQRQMHASSETTSASELPFWLKRRGVSREEIDRFYERRENPKEAEKSLAKAKKRRRESAEGPDPAEVTAAVLKMLDSMLNNFFTRSREAFKKVLMLNFLHFVLHDPDNSTVTLENDSDTVLLPYGAVPLTSVPGQEFNAEDPRTNKSKYDELLDSDALLFSVQYRVQVSGVPEYRRNASCFTTADDTTACSGTEEKPTALIRRRFNILDISNVLCVHFTHSIDLDQFLSRSTYALRSLYVVAVYLREILKQRAQGALSQQQVDEFRFLVASESIACRAAREESTVTWERFQDYCEQDMSSQTGRGLLAAENSDDSDQESSEGSENIIFAPACS
jgi:hypothetical protein